MCLFIYLVNIRLYVHLENDGRHCKELSLQQVWLSVKTNLLLSVSTALPTAAASLKPR